MIDVQEAQRREASFIGNLSGAQDDYEWIVENRAWVPLGFDGFTDWWEAKVRPVMRALSMRPTREIVSAGIEQVRREEAELPPAWRRTQHELAEMFGVGRDTQIIRQRSTVGVDTHGDDLDGFAEHFAEPLRAPTSLGEARRLTPAEYLREVATPSPAQLIVQSITNEWYTPARYLDAARKVLGGIDLDPASCEEANRTVGADRFYTQDDDGLTQQWQGRVWLNPPYGRLAGDFVSRLVDEYTAGNVPAAVVLVNAHCTDTRWFQPLWDHMLCFTDHRIDFSAGTEDRSGSTHGSVFAYLGPERRLFANTFTEFGAVVERFA